MQNMIKEHIQIAYSKRKDYHSYACSLFCTNPGMVGCDEPSRKMFGPPNFLADQIVDSSIFGLYRKGHIVIIPVSAWLFDF